MRNSYKILSRKYDKNRSFEIPRYRYEKNIQKHPTEVEVLAWNKYVCLKIR
jgi:hypothetical protein